MDTPSRVGPQPQPGAAAFEQPNVLRVMTWNVKDLFGDPLAVHRVLSGARPDVVCLQEVPRRIASRYQLSLLARRCGLYLGDGGRVGAGTAILTSLRTLVDHVRAHRLPVDGRLTRPRGFVRATIKLPGTQPVSITSLHLGLNPTERADHVDRLLRGLTDDHPALLAGDLNEKPGGVSWHALSNWAVDPKPGAPKTFSAQRPRARIDAILVDPRLEVLSYGDPDGLDEDDVRKASDHRPVFARVKLLAQSVPTAEPSR